MKLLWRMGWRNIWRNKRRTAITAGAMGFSVLILVFFIAMMADYTRQMEENVIGMSLGDLQIHHPRYLSDQNLHQLVSNADGIVDALKAEGLSAAPRSYGYGLLASDRTGKSAGVRLQGIDLQAEPTVTTLSAQRNLRVGSFLTGKTRTEEIGEPEETQPAPEFVDPLGGDDVFELGPTELTVGEVVLGRKLAGNLGVEPGDTVSVVSMAADGTMGNELFDVVGVLKNFSEIEDRSLALMTRADYQRLFHLPDGAAHEIAVRLPDDLELDAAKELAQGVAGDAVAVQSWREINPAMAEMVDFQQEATIIFSLTVYIGAALLIMNSMLMMVFERIREFGVMKAVGLRGRQLVGLVYFETFWICLISAASGFATGIPLVLWVGRVGLDLTRFAPDGFALSGTVFQPVLHTVVTPDVVTVPLLALFVIAFLSVLYPALKAAVIEPVRALHHI